MMNKISFFLNYFEKNFLFLKIKGNYMLGGKINYKRYKYVIYFKTI